MEEMTPRERFRAIMNFEPFDRLPVVEWCMWWDETTDRWRGEGLADGVRGDDLRRHFGLEIWTQRGVGMGPVPNVTIIEPVVRTMDEYSALVAGGLYPPNEQAIDTEMWQSLLDPQDRGEIVVWLTLDGPFWWPRILLGDQEMLLIYYDDPALMHRIIDDMTEYHLRTLDEVVKIITPDFMTWAEDFSYKHGPLIGRDLFDEFLAPYYRAVAARLHEHGVPCIVDTDGDPTISVPWFVDCGVDGLLPWEANAGCDVSAVRAQWPELLMIGGFNKVVMHQGEAAIRAEFERLLPTATTGGFIISCDHQTPPQVSLEDYQLYLRLFREYAEAAAK
jgi:hypothetical protein